VAVEAIRAGAVDYFVKSEVSLADLPHTAERAVRHRRIEEALRDLVERGAIRAVVAESFPFDKIVDAHAALESSRLPGAVVVDVASAKRDRREDGGRVAQTLAA